jgi:hypothetical protein
MFKARRKIDDVVLSSPLSRENRKQLTADDFFSKRRMVAGAGTPMR